MRSLIGRDKYKISNGLIVKIPLIAEIRGDNEETYHEYMSLISPFVMTSTDCMVELFEQGIDFQDLEDDWIFFCLNMTMGLERDYSMLFPELELCKFDVVEHGDELFVVEKNNNLIISRKEYEEISEVLCKANFIEKKHRKFANQRALEKAVSMEKKKRERRSKEERNQLDELILFAANNKNFKYDFDSVNKLSLYTFYACVKQIQNDNHIDNLMLGGYTGNVDLSKLSSNELNRFITL